MTMSQQLQQLLLALLLLFSSLTSAAVNNVIQSIKDLDYDENGKLASHYLLYPDNVPQDCVPSTFGVPYGFQSRAVAGQELQDKIFSHYGSHQQQNVASSCRAVCLDKGTDRSVAHAAMPHKHWKDGSDKFEEWFSSACTNVEVCFMNYHDKTAPLDIYWVKDEVRKPILELKYGERNTKCFSSFVGHSFEAVTKSGETVGRVRIEAVTVLAFGESPPSDDVTRHNFDSEIMSTLRHEWERHERVKRFFSPLGFQKGRLPEDIFASMGSFFYNNRYNKVREEWNGKGVFVNWWETECSFIQIPWGLKGKWQARLRELVEAWAGVEVEQTDMYGLRQYEAGARLLTHVDRLSTHAVSLIVNIAQGNLSEPWPVEVYDHAGRLHEVIMQPGDIVYYESAKALHGRNRPLAGDGAYYVNLFTHYRPTGDPEWFEKDTSAGIVAVQEMKGKCRLQATEATADMGDGRLGVVQAVRCDDDRLGPYISPTLFEAQSGEDLIDWWKSTSPTFDESDAIVENDGRDEL